MQKRTDIRTDFISLYTQAHSLPVPIIQTLEVEVLGFL